MAEGLIKQWRLAVLRIQLELSGHDPRVWASLVSHPDDQEVTLWSDDYPPGAFGMPAAGPPTTLTVPADLLERVGATLVDDLAGEFALWLRLVPPYGYLGAAPWEETLVPATGVPVLRVPDRLPAAGDFGAAWTAAIAVNARPGSTWAPGYLRALFEVVQREIASELDVHVFADSATAHALREDRAAGSGSAPEWWHVHDPGDAVHAHQSRSGRRERKASTVSSRPGGIWADWIAAELAGRAVRSLHVALDAAFDGDHPRLVVSPDPNEPVGLDRCAFVPPDGLLRLADGIGAATLSFGSPPDNPADLATRLIADHVGQRRAGPTLFSSVAADPTGRALIEAQIYLADRTGRHPIPQDPSLFIYAQPEHVKDSLEQPWVVTPPTPATSATGTLPLPGFSGDDEELPDEPAERYYADKTTVPGWVAASHRYLSTESAHLSRVLESSGDVPVESAYDLGAAEALAEIRSIVARHSGSS